MDKVKVGIVGVGFIGRIHIEALRRLGYVEVVALVSRKKETADALARDLTVPKAYSRYEDLLNDKEIDAVHLTTVNNLHAPLARQAMEAGKHVLCEKPLAMNSKEAADLLKVARQTGVCHALCHNMRYYPLVKQARAMVRAGEAGEIRLVHGQYLQDWLFLETDYNWRLVSKWSGGSRAVADIGTHWLDMVQHITGQKVVEVCADLTTFIPVRKKPKVEAATYVVRKLKASDYEDVKIDTEDHGTVMLRFSGGAKGALLVSQVCAGRKNFIHFEINGSKKSLEWNGEDPNTMWVGERGKLNGEFIKDPVMFVPDAARYAHAPCGLGEGYLDTFKNVFSDFHGWIRSGRKMDEGKVGFPTFVTGLQELQLVDSVLASHAAGGKWVKVKYGQGAEADYR
ncbi:MAG: Gfo/Idh/MocA family oxidoreductase [Spirochaetales bacterium]|nr:Gfo/Idh/MocA family oxidoreductase [Spirochaetales bacterium]